MSETPHTEPSTGAHAAEPASEPASEPLPEYDAAEPVAEPSPVVDARDSRAPRASRFTRWGTVAALLLAIIATAVAVAGWFYPHKTASSQSYSDQQTQDAKKKMCEVFMKADRAVVRNSHLKPTPEAGPIGAFAIGTAARQAFLGSAAYLRDQVSQTPATPSDLAKSVNAMASSLQDLAIGALAGDAGFTQDEVRQSLDDKIKITIDTLVNEGAAERHGDKATCKQ